MTTNKFLLGLAGAACLLSTTTFAQTAEDLPSVVTWSAYGPGSSGHAQAVAMGAALQNNLGTTLRILPGQNDVSRMVPLRDDRVMFSAAGIASFFAQEGLNDFGTPNWGPQPVRLLLASSPNHNQGIAATEESGIENVADLAGKRVAAVVGAPAINNGIEAILAFAELSWEDVERVDYPGYSASWDGMNSGQVDAAWGATTISGAYQLENSSRGIHWLPVPHDNDAGWERIQSLMPHIFRHNATEGAGISEEEPHEGTNYPYPILITYADQDPMLVQSMTEALIQTFPDYQDAAPGADGWALDKQPLGWIMPFHEGAVAALRGAGVWSEEYEQHNQALIDRQDELAEAWQRLQEQGLEGDELTEAWERERANIPLPPSIQ
ncbi:TAXI family TRAP transporter solute-binding subunit [Vreelandella glaciei]|uniref:TAXI family TRAP transporter solute-binding subunit n=1 Tax=Vreelandella glaciei TaxID=186761 RepID=UPI00300339A9